ncbi:MAG: flagellar biosynthetic protein FliP, partial [Candidatus Zixiibacteriota bacterium]
MKQTARVLSVFLAVWCGGATTVVGQTLPKISLEVGKASNPSDVSTTLQIILLLTILSLAPALLIMITS